MCVPFCCLCNGSFNFSQWLNSQRISRKIKSNRKNKNESNWTLQSNRFFPYLYIMSNKHIHHPYSITYVIFRKEFCYAVSWSIDFLKKIQKYWGNEIKVVQLLLPVDIYRKRDCIILKQDTFYLDCRVVRDLEVDGRACRLSVWPVRNRPHEQWREQIEIVVKCKVNQDFRQWRHRFRPAVRPVSPSCYSAVGKDINIKLNEEERLFL